MPRSRKPRSRTRACRSILLRFELEEVGDGTRLTVTESGFDQLPAARRDEAFESNKDGWEKQMGLVRNFVERH